MDDSSKEPSEKVVRVAELGLNFASAVDKAYDRGRIMADATTLIMIPDRFRVMPTCKEPSAYGIAVGASIAAILSALEAAEAKAKDVQEP